jgi:hypothetical protein
MASSINVFFSFFEAAYLRRVSLQSDCMSPQIVCAVLSPSFEPLFRPSWHLRFKGSGRAKWATCMAYQGATHMTKLGLYHWDVVVRRWKIYLVQPVSPKSPKSPLHGVTIHKNAMWNHTGCWHKSRDRPWRPIALWDVEDPTFSRQSAHRWWWGYQIR